MLGQNWASTYTIPQTTQNQLAFLTASATWKPTDTWTYQAIAYFRNFRRSHVDGNGTNTSNDPTVCPDPTSAVLSRSSTVRCPEPDHDPGPDGRERGRARLSRVCWAKSIAPGPRPTVSQHVQAATYRRLLGHNDDLTMGLSVDRGLVQFSTTSELGTVRSQSVPDGGGFRFLHQPALSDVAPVRFGATTLYAGLYATDTFDVLRVFQSPQADQLQLTQST